MRGRTRGGVLTGVDVLTRDRVRALRRGGRVGIGALVAGMLLRAVPSLLVDLGVNGYLAMIFFGAALLHALITAPRGLMGQWMAAISRVRARRRAP